MNDRRGPTSHVLTPDENRRGGSSRSDSKQRTAADNGRAHLGRFRHTEAAANSVRRGGETWGRKTSAMRRECLDCGLTTTPGALGQHQKFRAHSGYIEHDPITNKENP